MTNEQFEREKDYQTAMSVARRMLEAGLIDEADYRVIDTEFAKKFRPLTAEL